jgi:hypothetical protein
MDPKSFDGDLQMFREPSKPVNLAHLRFLRWLVEHGRLELLPANSSTGEPAEPTTGDASLLNTVR